MLHQRSVRGALRRSSIALRLLRLQGQRSNFSKLSGISSSAASRHSFYAPQPPLSCSPARCQPLTRRFASTTTQPTPIGDPGSLSRGEEFNPTDSFGSIDPYDSQIYRVDEHVGYLKELGLDYGWGPTSVVEWVFEHTYLYSGLSWGGTIVLITTIFRLGMMKLMTASSDNQARMAAVREIATDIDARLKEAKFNGDTRQMMIASQERQQLMAAYGVKTLRSFAPIFVQMPIGIGTFRLLRGMGALPMPGFETAGFLWFTDLSMSDPYYALPMIAAACYFASFQISSRSGLMPPPSFATKVILQGLLPCVAFVVGIFLPASIQMSFTITGFFAMVQAYLFGNPRVRRALGMFAIPTKTEAKPQAPPTINIKGRAVKKEKPIETPPSGLVPKAQWHLSNTRKEFAKSWEDVSRLVGAGESNSGKRKKRQSRSRHNK